VGNAPLEISGIAASDEFNQTNDCGTSLATGASCTISVALNPSTSGDATGTLTISDNAVDSPQVVSLTGVGTEVSLSATSLTFPAQKVGTTIARPLVVTNHGSAPVSVTSVTATGDFTATKLCAYIPPHGRCATNVLFKPTQTGVRTGVLTITDSDPGSPQMVALTSTGTPR